MQNVSGKLGDAPVTPNPVPAAVPPVDLRLMRKIVTASVIGNAMEAYDFFLYGTAAALIFGQLFFPAGTSPLVGTLGSLAGFAVGFVARPFGAILFGHVGDRFGRKGALIWTLALMGVATTLIGVLPTYAQAGFWAPLLLVVLRILQGIANGGEWGGGVLMISENAPAARRGFYASWSQLGLGGGFVLSAAAFFAVQQLPHEQFVAWGWRLPFLASLLIFGLGVYIRSNLPESAEFKAVKQAGETTRAPLIEVLRTHPKEVLMAMGLRVAETGGSYIFLVFALVYGRFVGISNSVMLAGVILSMLIELGMMVVWGNLSDRIGRRPVYFIGAAGLCIVAFPFFWLLDTKVTGLIWLAFILGNPLCHGAMVGTQPSLMSELFNTKVRYSGMSLGHEITSALVGGLSPLVATALFAHYHSGTPVALLLILFGLVTCISVACTRETWVKRV